MSDKVRTTRLSPILSEELELSIFNELRKNYNLETYTDYANMLRKMAISLDYMIQYNNAPMDDVEHNNLETLVELLDICTSLMSNCDPMYRE